MANRTPTQPAPRVTPPLGDFATRHLASLLTTFLITGQCSPSLLNLIDQRGATLADIRTELLRRETLGTGVR